MRPTYRDVVQSTGTPLLPAASGWVLRQELTGRGVVLATGSLLAASAWVAVQLGGQLGAFFGLCFVLVSLTGALAADDRALFTAGVLPPLALVGAVLAVSVLSPDAVAADTVVGATGPLTRVVAGMIDLATALVLGHVATLAVVAARVTTRLWTAG